MIAPRHILHLFVTLPMGGAENLLLSILRHLPPERYRSTVCCIRDKEILGREVEARGFSVLELGLLTRGGWDWRIVRRLQEVIRGQQIDLVHSHLYHANLYGRLAAYLAHVPCVASIHNTYADKRKRHRHLINRLLARRTAAIIAGSEEIRKDIIRYDRVPEDGIEVIPNAVDLTLSLSLLSREEARARLELPPGEMVVGNVARLEKQKGQRYLIEAMAQWPASLPRATLLLVGEGREEASLRDLAASLGIADRVRFLGTRRDLGDLFRAMDLFVMPSLWEGLSLAMVSAMAAGLPVIATDVGGVPEVLDRGRCGKVVSPMDPKALALAMLDLASNKERAAAMAARGQQRAREHYSDQAMTARVMAIYDRVLTQPKMRV